ncbi:MAG TPA: TetR/AcrR family transcriptional regulator [Streptosporangiaceae bacterium]
MRGDPYEDREPQAKTNTRILNAAARLFYRSGIRAVSVDEIAAAASVTKVTVYKHYQAKDELLAACLHALDQRFFSWFVDEVEASTDDPYGRLLAVFDVLGRWFRRRDFRGCAFINTTVELADPRHPAQEAVMAHKTRCRRYFRALAEAAGLDDPDAISDQWMLLTEGATITALVEGDQAAARKARAGADAILRAVQAAA